MPCPSPRVLSASGFPGSHPGAPHPTVASLRPRAVQSIVNHVSSLAPPPGPLKPVTNPLSSISSGAPAHRLLNETGPPGHNLSSPLLLRLFPSHAGAAFCQPWVDASSVFCPRVWTQATCQLPLCSPQYPCYARRRPLAALSWPHSPFRQSLRKDPGKFSPDAATSAPRPPQHARPPVSPSCVLQDWTTHAPPPLSTSLPGASPLSCCPCT